MYGEPPPARSALTLRLVLSVFGVAMWITAAVLSAVLDLPVGWVIAFGVLAVIALVDLVIVAWRKRREKS
jgi:membrane protein implicated in regulation of membrane protease activity